MTEDERRDIHKALGELEAAIFADPDVFDRLRLPLPRLLMAALSEAGTLVEYQGLPDGPLDLEGNDCSVLRWKTIAILAVHAIVRARASERATATPPEPAKYKCSCGVTEVGNHWSAHATDCLVRVTRGT